MGPLSVTNIADTAPDAAKVVKEAVEEWKIDNKPVLLPRSADLVVCDADDPLQETCSPYKRDSSTVADERRRLSGIERLPVSLALVKVASENKARLKVFEHVLPRVFSPVICRH